MDINPRKKCRKTFEKKYSQENRYDRFSALYNLIPSRELYSVAMPDYGPRTAAARTATVAMPAGAVTEHLKKWENYDPTASKKVSKIENY